MHRATKDFLNGKDNSEIKEYQLRRHIHVYAILIHKFYIQLFLPIKTSVEVFIAD